MSHQPSWANNVWLEDRKLVVALPRKAACTTLKRALYRVCFPDCPDPGFVHNLSTPGWREIYPWETPAECELIGAIREPFRRLWSGWCQARGPDIPTAEAFARFVQEEAEKPDEDLDVHVVPQAFYLLGPGPAHRRPTSWLVVESLADDWAALCRRQGWSPWVLGRDNARERNGYDVQAWGMSLDTRRLVWRRWAADFELHLEAQPRREAVRERLTCQNMAHGLK